MAAHVIVRPVNVSRRLGMRAEHPLFHARQLFWYWVIAHFVIAFGAASFHVVVASLMYYVDWGIWSGVTSLWNWLHTFKWYIYEGCVPGMAVWAAASLLLSLMAGRQRRVCTFVSLLAILGPLSITTIAVSCVDLVLTRLLPVRMLFPLPYLRWAGTNLVLLWFAFYCFIIFKYVRSRVAVPNDHSE